MNTSLLRKHLLILALAFVVSILFRLPNLDRPVSKHHEFNTAVILNGTISWQEAGGASVFHFVPLMTYQGEANRLLARGPFADASGNQVYLSLGPGWYVLPYLFFRAFHLPFTPFSLQVLNLLIHLLVLLVLYRLAGVIRTSYGRLSPHFPLYTCLVFLFIPGPLWYFGNGYVHAAISLPFAILLFTQFLKWHTGQSRFSFSSALFFLLWGAIGIYLDWFSFFLLGILAATAVVTGIRQKSKRAFRMAGWCLITAFVSVAAIFGQFASLLGYRSVLQYWTERAGYRSLNNDEVSFLHNLIALGTNLFSCAGVIVLMAVLAVWMAWRKKSPTFPWRPCLLWLAACFCYNGFFFNWSYAHEFSMVPLCLLLSLLAAFFIVQVRPPSRARMWLLVLVAINLVQYYGINPPGALSRAGTPYDDQQRLGREIARLVPPDYRIFSTQSNEPMVEYYAHRSFTFQPTDDPATARRICDEFGVQKAVWLKIDSFRIREVHWLKGSASR